MKGIRIALLALLVFSITGCLDTGNKEYMVTIEHDRGVDIISKDLIMLTRNQIEEGRNNSFVFGTQYNKKLERVSGIGCTVENTNNSVTITDISKDCSIYIFTEDRDDAPRGLYLTLSDDKLYRPSRDTISMSFHNLWNELNINRVTVIGVLYKLEKKSDSGERTARRITDFQKSIRHLSSSQYTTELIYSGTDFEIWDHYLIEIIDVVNCSFGRWIDNSCLYIVNPNDKQEGIYLRGNICIRGDDRCSQYF